MNAARFRSAVTWRNACRFQPKSSGMCYCSPAYRNLARFTAMLKRNMTTAKERCREKATKRNAERKPRLLATRRAAKLETPRKKPRRLPARGKIWKFSASIAGLHATKSWAGPARSPIRQILELAPRRLDRERIQSAETLRRPRHDSTFTLARAAEFDRRPMGSVAGSDNVAMVGRAQFCTEDRYTESQS